MITADREVRMLKSEELVKTVCDSHWIVPNRDVYFLDPLFLEFLQC